MRRQKALIDLWEINPGELNWFIGAGGKTTTINRLAGELDYNNTIISTTTAILKPETIPHKVVFINSYQELYNQVGKYFKAKTTNPKTLVLASAKKHHRLNKIKAEKLIGLNPEWLTEIAKEFPELYYLIEADGAANRPIKIPAEHEPVLPESIDNLFLVQGLTGLSRAYSKNIDKRIMHRAELFNHYNSKPALSTYKMLYSPRYWGYKMFKSSREMRFILTQINSGIIAFSEKLVGYLADEFIQLDNLKSITAVNYRKRPETIYHLGREEYLNSGDNKFKRY